MVDFYTVGAGDEVTKNGKLIVDKLVEARNDDKIRGLSSEQLDDVFKLGKDNERFVAARKAIDKVAGSYDSGSVDEKGNTLSIDEKIEKVNKGDEFPYNIPIIGWICQKIEIAMLKSKKNKIKEGILNRIENGGLIEQEKIKLGKENVQTLSNNNNLCDNIRNDIAKDEQKNKKIIEDYGKIVVPAFNYAAQRGIINNEQKDQIVGKFANDNVNQSTDKTLTEEQWKALETLVEQHKKEEQDKKEKKEETVKVKPNVQSITDDRKNYNNITNSKENVLKKANVSKNIDNNLDDHDTQPKQTQTVAPVPQAQIQSKVAGMQIGGLSNAGTNINSGAIGGKGATQEVQR